MVITAKVHCASRVKEAHNAEGESTVTFTANYANEAGERINEEWAKATPLFTCQMVVLDSVPFEAGQNYTLTFEPSV